MNCDNCNSPAIINIQKAWISWEYNPEKGEYSKNHKLLLDVEDPTGSENLHLCHNCLRDWKNGSIVNE